MRISNNDDLAAEPKRQRATQADIARRAGVSQATVSLVLNGRSEHARISDETRARVLEAIRDERYAANAAARTLAGGRNRILGVYTFESVFPIDSQDFYFPFLLGIEQQAEELGLDLLLFTSAGGTRKMYRDGGTRLRIADGALLLGRNPNLTEIQRLRDEGFCFVYIGHLEVEGTPISYVAADYAGATAALTSRAFDLGHRRFAYVRQDDRGAQPSRDRELGYRDALRSAGVPASASPVWDIADRSELASLVEEARRSRITVLLVEQTSVATELVTVAAKAGVAVPDDLSVIVLGDDIGSRGPSADWTRLSVPGHEMGAAASRLLVEMLENDSTPVQQLSVPCTIEDGRTLAGPNDGGAGD
jgi:DNA-binding LacI/PurR family transcriptional regulator